MTLFSSKWHVAHISTKLDWWWEGGLQSLEQGTVLHGTALSSAAVMAETMS